MLDWLRHDHINATLIGLLHVDIFRVPRYSTNYRLYHTPLQQELPHSQRCDIPIHPGHRQVHQNQAVGTSPILSNVSLHQLDSLDSISSFMDHSLLAQLAVELQDDLECLPVEKLIINDQELESLSLLKVVLRSSALWLPVEGEQSHFCAVGAMTCVLIKLDRKLEGRPLANL